MNVLMGSVWVALMILLLVAATRDTRAEAPAATAPASPAASGAPVEGTLEAVVIADRAEIADAWSTALLVLGANRTSLDLAEKAGLDGLFFDSPGRSASAAGWEAASRGRAR